MGQPGKTIAVFGSSRREENSVFYREAYELGRALAEAGYAVLSGGYNGAMAAVSRGAAEAGAASSASRAPFSTRCLPIAG